MFITLFKGFATSASLIMAIGAQNAFVIRQGLARNYLFLTAFMCSILDAFLISLGIVGFGELITIYPELMNITKYFAIAFLVVYGFLSLKSAFKAKSLTTHHPVRSLQKTILLLLTFSLLNPHAYLDTVVLLGSIAAELPVNDQIYFGIGAVSASFIWFFSLTYGSHLLSPLLNHASTWRVIDILIAIMMWGIALSL